MKRLIGGAALLVAVAALSACGAKKDPNLPTAEESAQLNNAAEMLDASPDSLAVNEDVALGNGDETSQDSIDEDGDAGNGAGNGQ
jgi:predicted small lipoprotein YifL